MTHKKTQTDDTATRVADPRSLITPGPIPGATQGQEITPQEALEDDPDEMPDAKNIKRVMEALQGNQKPHDMRDLEEAPAMPDWVKLPPNFKPPKGVQVIFMLFRAEWTANPKKGDRQCIGWPVSVTEEKNALARARGDVLRSIDELAKQMVKVVDGVPVDWTGTNPEGNIDQWWNEVGPKCRNILHRIYTQTHNLNDDEHADFFENCIAVRTVG